MRFLIISSFLCISSISFVYADPGDTIWTRIYGGDENDIAYSIDRTTDGGFVIAGETKSFGHGGFDYYIIKIDAAGDTLWTRTIGGSSADHAKFIQCTNDGGYIIVGTTLSFGEWVPNIWLVKLNANGNTSWTRHFFNNMFNYADCVRQTSDGGYIIAGWSGEMDISHHDFYIIKTDSDGHQQWTENYDAGNPEMAYSITQTADSGYIIAGCSLHSFETQEDFRVLKIRSNASVNWDRYYGDSDLQAAHAVMETSDNGYLIVGISTDTMVGRTYVVKTDYYGDTLWTRTYPGSMRSALECDDGGYLISSVINGDINILKINSNGDSLWSRLYLYPDFEAGNDIEKTDDGNYIICGDRGDYSEGGSDIFLVKIEGEQTEIDGNTIVLPSPAILRCNYPNPFNVKTTIPFTINKPARVNISIYDILGQKVTVLVNDILSAGDHNIIYDASSLASGVYFYRLESGGISEIRMMNLIK